MKWVPDRKVLAGGLGGIIAWAVIMLLQSYAGITLPPDLQTMIVGAAMTLLAYVVPPSARDIVTRLNDGLVAMAAADPKIPVSATPPKVASQIVQGLRSSASVLLAGFVLLGLAACTSVKTVESAAPSVTTAPIAQAVQQVKEMPPEERWRLTCLAADGIYIGYVAMAAPGQSEATNAKVQGFYDGVKVFCANKPDNYGAAVVTLLHAFSAFKAAIPAKAA